jgi:precorrin isomerase
MESVAEQLKFEKALIARRHKEIKEGQEAIVDALLKKEDDGVKKAIEKLSDSITVFLEESRNKEAAKIDDKVVISESKTEKAILDSLNELKKTFELSQKPKQWVHTVTKRSYSGYADEITSNQIK